MFICPLTSLKSTSSSSTIRSNSATIFTTEGLIVSSPFRNLTTSIKLFTPKTSNPATTAASLAFSIGTIIPLYPSFLACKAIGKIPFNGLRFPSKDSSPINIYSANLSITTCSLTANIPIAIGKSNTEPSFRISAGAMFTVISFPGNFRSLFLKAALILC